MARVTRVQIAGVGMSPSTVEELARRLTHAGSLDLALRILRAQREEHEALELSAGEAVRALEVLDEPTPGLEPLLGVLLSHAGRSERSSG